ncbi:uncharacterized protein F4822DRAFT_161955 [Hypoxylon trugodes]|uniref:uncharacterized protein n=1 Tax=Hypoxylon trugodes TaxID=326681 RepID=UPI00218D97A4|nr:uncharacterized protein F4822DRAFT_161955 [Hypoxylon trugodes]KAI1390713.1 hypothetical protein F4822DRAFT_161955 [Hypoxylon trugodes]
MSKSIRGRLAWRKLFQNRPKLRKESDDSGFPEARDLPQLNDLSTTELYGLFEFPVRAARPESPPLPPNAQCVDIIAVHGLGGSWRTTWNGGDSDDPAIWLRDRLPELFARMNVRPRVRAFGYDASYVFTSSTSDLESCAEDLLTRIRIARQTEEEREAPIIFVAHSLGGLVVKQAINIAHTDNEYHQDVLDKTCGCLFLAVPFHGSDAASWAQLGSQILNTLSLGMAGNSNLPKALKRNSRDWMKISRDFVQRGRNMTFRSAYETQKMGRSAIVDKASVWNNVPNERVFPVPGSNHRNICRFGDHEDGRFGPIGLAMTELVRAALDDLTPKLLITTELPVSTPTFHGRSTQIEELASILNPAKSGRKGVVLYGIGGSGKTQLSLQYIRKKKRLYKAILWINAFTPEQIKQSFTDAFNLISKSWPSKDLPNPYFGENKRDFVLAKLRSTLYRNWLLVIDSADDLTVHDLVQLIPHSSHGSIILTSTRKDASDILEPHGFSSIQLDGLDNLSGKELLLDRAGMSDFTQGAEEAMAIVKELNSLPLSLKQAAILLRRRVVNLDNFIEQYHAQYDELMGYLPKAGEVQHDKTRSMHAILNMLYSYVRQESPAAAAIIRILAILGPVQVPISTLLQICRFDSPVLSTDTEFRALPNCSDTTVIFRLHLKLLEDVCLIRFGPVSENSPESMLLHRAICQWIVKSQVTGKAQWILFVAFALCNILCRGEGDLDWPMGGVTPDSYLSRRCLTWVDRMSSLIKELVSPADLQPPTGCYKTEYASIARDYGYIYFCNARYKEAITFLSQAVKYIPFQDAADNDPSKSNVQLLYCLGVSHFKIGNFAQAVELVSAACEEPSRGFHDETIRVHDRLRAIFLKAKVNEDHFNTAVIAAQGPKISAITRTDANQRMGSIDDVLESEQVLVGNNDNDSVDLGPDFREWLVQKSGMTPIIWAASNGRESLFRRLLSKHHDDIQVVDKALLHAAKNGHYRIVHILLEAERPSLEGGKTALLHACRQGRNEVVRYLLRYAGIMVRDTHGMTPLHLACEFEREEIVRLLLDHDSYAETVNDSMETSLHCACRLGNIRIVRLLLDRGAYIEARTISHQTPLHKACELGREGVARVLLDHNASIEAKGLLNETPLHKACEFGHEGVVRLLLSHKAQIGCRDLMRHTPLDKAIIKGHDNIVQLLLSQSRGYITN